MAASLWFGWLVEKEPSRRSNWLLIKHREAFAVADDGEAILGDYDTSVASGRTMALITAEKGRKPKPFMLRRAGASASFRR